MTRRGWLLLTLPLAARGEFPADEEEVARFLSTFRAADPAYQGWCAAYIGGSATRRSKQVPHREKELSLRLAGTNQTEAALEPLEAVERASQAWQDLFIWRNLFLQQSLRGEKGFYVDSGTNHWFDLSNTFFFDKCLGCNLPSKFACAACHLRSCELNNDLSSCGLHSWDGLCVEPTRQYWRELRTHRSCKLITECISDAPGTVIMSDAAANSKIGNPFAAHRVKCDTLRNMLATVNRTHVDFWSLDVESHEMVVLRHYVPADVSVSVLLVEDVNHESRALDFLCFSKGFVKFHQLALDRVFVSRSELSRIPTQVWMPEEMLNVTQDHFDKQEKAWACNSRALDYAREKCVCAAGLTHATDKRCSQRSKNMMQAIAKGHGVAKSSLALS